MKGIDKKKFKGFTLIELVVYIGVAGIMILALAGSIIQITRLYAQSKAYYAVTENGNSALQKISQEIMSANSINEAESDFITAPHIIALNDSGTADFKRIRVGDSSSGTNVLYLDIGSPLVTSAITSEIVDVQDFTVEYISGAQSPPSLKINLVLKSTTTKYDVTESFFTTVDLRNY